MLVTAREAAELLEEVEPLSLEQSRRQAEVIPDGRAARTGRFP